MVTVFGYGNDAECVSHWRRYNYVPVLGNMGHTCHFVDDVEMCNCDLTHGRYVIGGGTGEFPPPIEMNISVLGCVAC